MESKEASDKKYESAVYCRDCGGNEWSGNAQAETGAL